MPNCSAARKIRRFSTPNLCHSAIFSKHACIDFNLPSESENTVTLKIKKNGKKAKEVEITGHIETTTDMLK
ncbi:hypothetical protein EA58_16970 [Photobacterium galatheae]|uniref:Uncharacterized protein n=1 Tax=Photobacterium galatheae TaxID=1654360 RepID=A0A066RSN9_9GAMM|nr:hypothetical protein EA58_16970 [Photobacterium galatheae]